MFHGQFGVQGVRRRLPGAGGGANAKRSNLGVVGHLKCKKGSEEGGGGFEMRSRRATIISGEKQERETRQLAFHDKLFQESR